MAGTLSFLKTNANWLAAGALLTFASSFGQTFFIAVFAGEIRAEFGLSHGQWGSIYALATMASALVMVFAGTLTDRFRVRGIGIAICAGLVIAAVLMSLATSLAVLIVAVFLLRLMGQGMMWHTSMTGMARWFVASRGRAISIASLGVAAGEAVLPLMFVALLGLFDWRILWLVAAFGIATLMPVFWRLLKTERSPGTHADQAGSEGMLGRHWTRREMLGNRLFWFMIPVVIGPAAWNTALFFHQVHIADVSGIGHGGFVALFPLFTATAIAALIFAGWSVDRFGTGRIAGVFLLPSAVGYLVLSGAEGVFGIGSSMVLIAISVGISNTFGAAFWAENFGTRHIGAIRAAAAAVMVLGTAIGPALTGALIDLGLSFPEQGRAIALYYVVASLIAGVGVRSVSREMAARQ